MRTSDPPRRPALPWPRLLAWCLALAALTIATRLPLLKLERPIDDEVVYGVVAQTIVDGGAPYANAVERKPPLLFYAYAAVLRTFGRSNWRALHAVEIVWIFATMAGLFVLARRLFDVQTGLVAALLYSVFQAWSYWNNLAFNGEVLMNLPIVWAFAIGISCADERRVFRLFLAGTLVAIAFLLKQPAAVAIVPLASYVIAPQRSGRSPAAHGKTLVLLSSLFLGFAVIVLAVVLWLLERGLLGAALYWTITDHSIPEVYWRKGLENTLAFAAFCLPITAGAWASCRSRSIWAGRGNERNALCALAIVSLVGAASSGRFYPHYYIAVIPACALLSAPWLASLWRSDGNAVRGRLAFVTQAWLAATVAVFAASHAHGLARQPAVSEAGRYLLAHSSTGDRIFVWGQATRIYVDAQRRPASRYIATFPLTGHIFGAPPPPPGAPPPDTRVRIVPGSWENLREDFIEHEPAFIIDTESKQGSLYPVRQFPALEELLQKEYEPVARTADGIIYRRDADRGRRFALRLDP